MLLSLSWFQSHNGAIAARLRRWTAIPIRAVSIPQWCDCCIWNFCNLLSRKGCFNPTMVRLLPIAATVPRIAVGGFNPTMVRLLHFQRCEGCCPACVFQSHNGAIAACPKWNTDQRPCLVSIPQWCDCCMLKPTLPFLWVNVSIPQWCDCCCSRLS